MLEEERNALLLTNNQIQGNIAALHGSHNDLRSITNALASDMARLMESNNQYMAKNTELLQASIDQFDQGMGNATKYASAVNLIQNEVVAVEPNELQLINRLFNGEMELKDMPAVYAIVYRYFPHDFAKPSNSPRARVDTPEVLMLDAISYNSSSSR